MSNYEKDSELIFDLLEKFTEHEIEAFLFDIRAAALFSKFVKLVKPISLESNFTGSFCSAYACTPYEYKDMSPWKLIIEKIDKLDAKTLNFIKEQYNKLTDKNLNIMQIHKMIKESIVPFELCEIYSFGEFKSLTNSINDLERSNKNQTELIKQFADNGIVLTIKK